MKAHLAVLAFVLTPVVSQATMTPGLQRGDALLPIPGRTQSVCVIPTHLPEGDYSKKDLEMERALCGLTEDVNAAICPKQASTNPGIEFYTVPEGYTVQQAMAKNCFIANPQNAKDNLLKKVAKYKNSTSCSYTPSLVAYYHVSRLLNEAGHVPPAVIRTFDLSRHIEIAELGKSLATRREGASAIIAQTWSSLLSALKAGPASKRKDVLFTDSFDQTYGALQQNPTGEAKYSALYTPAKGSETRAEAFRDRNAIFQLVKSKQPVAKIAGTQFNAQNLQTILSMKDAADMIVMDTLLSQEDRFGNTHMRPRYAFINPAVVGKDGWPKVQFESKPKSEIMGFNPVIVNQMVLKDNDCGVNRENRAAKAGLLKFVAHIDPKTYKGILKMDAMANTDAFVKTFIPGLLFTIDDFAKMRTNLKTIAADLKARCQAGTLRLDLDLDAHFAGQTKTNDCEM